MGTQSSQKRFSKTWSKQDPGWIKQNRYARAVTNFSQPHANHLWELGMWKVGKPQIVRNVVNTCRVPSLPSSSVFTLRKMSQGGGDTEIEPFRRDKIYWGTVYVSLEEASCSDEMTWWPWSNGLRWNLPKSASGCSTLCIRKLSNSWYDGLSWLRLAPVQFLSLVQHSNATWGTPRIVYRTTAERTKSHIGQIAMARFSAIDGNFNVNSRIDVLMRPISFGTNGYPINDF